MINQLVECVPNFSEARRPMVVKQIKEAIASVHQVHILNVQSDIDHNRTVITFVGTPEAVELAAYRGIAKAAALIDLNKHTGEHPRIGATDVVPFIPVSGVSMEECVQIAKRLGKRVAENLNIPIYFYEEAATKPERRNLENIRRGEYEKLKEEILTNPDRAPDLGPSSLGPAGATVIGARHFLIAFNVYLTTDDVSTAKKIARAVRNSSGGLRYVKALGLFVDGHAQVSMNLTNFKKTPIPRVVEFIRREAARYGTSIHHSELIGLIPQDALTDTAVWYTQMDEFTSDQILEKKIYQALSEKQSSNTFIEDLASGKPTPGGGSAAAQSGAMAAALVSMVARLTIGRKKYKAVEAQMKEILAEAESIRQAQMDAVELDSKAFESVMAAYKLPKEDPNRKPSIQKAMLKAAQVPLEVARLASHTIQLAARAAELGNLNAITDAGTAGALAWAAAQGAGYNVKINLASIQDNDIRESISVQLNEVEIQAKEFHSTLTEVLKKRGNL